MKKYGLINLIFLLFLLWACSKNENRGRFDWMMEYNKEREKFYLAPIDSNYRFKQEGDTFITWYPNSSNKKEISLMQKNIQYKGKVIFKEEDIYVFNNDSSKSRLILTVYPKDTSMSIIELIKTRYEKKYGRDDYFVLEVDTIPLYPIGLTYLDSLNLP